jgi:hypothetical protein
MMTLFTEPTEQNEAGLASGLVNTSFMMGGALGLAVLASLAASRTSALPAQGEARQLRSPAATTPRSSPTRSPRRPPPRWAPSCFAPRRRRPRPNSMRPPGSRSLHRILGPRLPLRQDLLQAQRRQYR